MRKLVTTNPRTSKPHPTQIMAQQNETEAIYNKLVSKKKGSLK